MAYSLVAHVAAASANSTSVTTAGVDTTGATLLAVWVATQSGVTNTPSDSKGNTWTGLTAQNVGGGEKGQWYYVAAPTVGSGHTFSVTGSTLPAVMALAFSGSHATPFDKESGTSAFPQPISPGSVTPSQDGSLILQGTAYNAAGVVSINGGYTITDQCDLGANNKAGGAAYLIQTTAAATNPSWSKAGGNASMVAASAVFKPAAATGNRRRRVLLMAGGR